MVLSLQYGGVNTVVKAWVTWLQKVYTDQLLGSSSVNLWVSVACVWLYKPGLLVLHGRPLSTDRSRREFHAFVCYTYADRDFVMKMVDELEVRRGLKLCINARDLLGGGSKYVVTAELIENRWDTRIRTDGHTIPTYTHTYLHTYLSTYLPTYIRTHTYTHTHTYIHTYIHTYMHTYAPTYLTTYISITYTYIIHDV